MSDKWKRSQIKMKSSAVQLQFWLPTTSIEMLTTRESLVT